MSGMSSVARAWVRRQPVSANDVEQLFAWVTIRHAQLTKNRAFDGVDRAIKIASELGLDDDGGVEWRCASELVSAARSWWSGIEAQP